LLKATEAKVGSDNCPLSNFLEVIKQAIKITNFGEIN
jgi:hypothetical protein